MSRKSKNAMALFEHTAVLEYTLLDCAICNCRYDARDGGSCLHCQESICAKCWPAHREGHHTPVLTIGGEVISRLHRAK